MRIGLVCHSGYGGSVRTTCRLAVALAEREHSVHLVAQAPPPWWPQQPRPNLHYQAVPEIAGFPFPDDLGIPAMAATLAELAQRVSLDLLHVHYAVPHAVSATLARAMLAEALRLPLLVTLHGTDVSVLGQQAPMTAVLRHTLSRCDGITAVSRALAQQARSSFDLSAIQVIPGFVDVSRFRRIDCPVEERRMFAGDDEPLLLHLSNFRPVKRSLDSVAVLARVNAQRPCRLLLVGAGPDLQACLQRARQLGVADRVIPLGPRADVVVLLSLADVLLLPSAKEAFGLVALEAMSCSLPVVASRVGGLLEVLGEEDAGVLCQPGDVAAMAEAALAVVEDPALARRLASRGRARAETLFDQERIIERYVRLYRRLLAA